MIDSIKELKKICRGTDNFLFLHDRLYIKFMRSLSIHFTKLFLYTKITPNQMSIVFIITGIVGAYLFSFGKYWCSIVGALLLQLMLILDNVDGEIARYRKQTSLKGRFLDSIGNRIVEPLIFIFLSFGVYKLIPDIKLFLLGAFVACSLLIREILIMIGPYLYFEITLAGGKIEIKEEKEKKKDKKNLLYYIKKIYDLSGFIFAFPGIQNILLISAILNILPYTFIFYGITLPITIFISLFYESNYCFKRVIERKKAKI